MLTQLTADSNTPMTLDTDKTILKKRVDNSESECMCMCTYMEMCMRARKGDGRGRLQGELKRSPESLSALFFFLAVPRTWTLQCVAYQVL